MTQTVKGQNNSPQKQRRPGQRQQERLQRQARRRRRQRILLSTIIALVVIAIAALSFWQYQRYSASQVAAAHVTATATAKSAHAHATAAAISAANATATAAAAQIAPCLAKLKTTPTPTAGPASPPALTGTPVTLAGGLQYIDVQVGCGPAAKSGSNVSVEYTGWLKSNGKKFDSSYDRQGQAFPLTLGQGQVIKGWDEGLVGMKKGGTRILIIPPSLAYGAQGSPPTIPANATLVFEVTMLSVQ